MSTVLRAIFVFLLFSMLYFNINLYRLMMCHSFAVKEYFE